jgi:predicted alpha/beta-fold hydrolase
MSKFQSPKSKVQSRKPDPQSHANQTSRDANKVRAFFASVQRKFGARPFRPHRIFAGAHAQTLAAYAWPRRGRLSTTVVKDEKRLFDVDHGVQVLAQCRWQEDRNEHGSLVIWHGMEGSTDSIYMWSTADKAFRAGFNVIRVNYRSCGNTEHLTPTIYHGGMSTDLAAVIDELIREGLKRIYPIGFSLGGNMVLKLAAEYGGNAPAEVIATCVVSPSVDLGASSRLICKASNWLYHRNFVRSMKARIRKKNLQYPELYDVTKLDQVKTILDFDEMFTARAHGFADAEDYYSKASSVRVVEQIRIPTLIIHAEDDPFIPFEPLRESSFTQNPFLLMVKTERGGHVAFVGEASDTEDRFWAENRAIEFCQLSEDYF